MCILKLNKKTGATEQWLFFLFLLWVSFPFLRFFAGHSILIQAAKCALRLRESALRRISYQGLLLIANTPNKPTVITP